MAQAHEAPCPADLRSPSEQKAPKPTRCLDLPQHGFDDDLASGVEGLAIRRPHVCGHPLRRRGRRVTRLGLRGMVLLTPRGPGGFKPSTLQGLCGGLTVIAVLQRRRDGVGLARLGLGKRKTGLGQGRQGRLGHGLRLLLVIRGVGDITG